MIHHFLGFLYRRRCHRSQWYPIHSHRHPLFAMHESILEWLPIHFVPESDVVLTCFIKHHHHRSTLTVVSSAETEREDETVKPLIALRFACIFGTCATCNFHKISIVNWRSPPIQMQHNARNCETHTLVCFTYTDEDRPENNNKK